MPGPAETWNGRWTVCVEAGLARGKAAEPFFAMYCRRDYIAGSTWKGRTMGERGSLVCVGVGMLLGAHLGPRARAHIQQADVVFAAVSDPLVELWLRSMHADVRSLQPFYAEGKSRRATYRQMVDAIMAEVRSGRRVCGAFYGHPGVFAQAPHDAIAQARREGFEACMEPGISAEDCLYADLGIDPATCGCQHYEASQFMFYRRRIDPAAYLVLWQIGVAGDRSCGRTSTGSAHRQLLVDLLSEDYPLQHEVVAYEAATLATDRPRIAKMPLAGIVSAELRTWTTLVIPPARPMVPNRDMLERIARLDAGQDGLASPLHPTSNLGEEHDVECTPLS